MRRMMLCWMWLMLLLPVAGRAQEDPSAACRVEDGQMMFTLDRRWTAGQRARLADVFDLDSALVADALRGIVSATYKAQGWKVRPLDAQRMILSKPLDAVEEAAAETDVTLLDDRWIKPSGVLERESVPYGMNRFTRVQSFSYRKGIAVFFLPGNTDARRVSLSGSFNGWSTAGASMEKTDSGWIARVQLKPGKYLYKYIIDGQWSPDPFNRLRENDTYGERNSVVFCYNHIFYLRDYHDARVVRVAGSFNGWNAEELPMRKVPGGWIRALYLREGTHAYKFLIDYGWTLDPANNVSRDDGRGNENSYVSIGDTFYFKLAGNTAIRKVYVAGDFNGWNPGELQMTKIDGGWELPYVLRSGNYQYKYILDGRWITDPGNPYSTGVGETKNSFLPVKPNHLFALKGHTDAETVIVTGSFNGWNTKEYRMVRQGDQWIFPIRLNPGKYTYKFIVDGVWMIDPANKLWEENQYNTGNSVLWVEM